MEMRRHLFVPVMRLTVLILTILILYYLITVKHMRIVSTLTNHKHPTNQTTEALTNHKPPTNHKTEASPRHSNKKPNIEISDHGKRKNTLRFRSKLQTIVKPKTVPQFFNRNFRVPGIHCDVLFSENAKTRSKMRKRAFKYKKGGISPQKYLKITQTHNCLKFKTDREYVTIPLSSTEKQFPLAYSIVMHDSVYQFEILLRSIYRPQNYYCVHVDKKADKLIKASVKSITKCFPNVFYVKFHEDVHRNHISAIHAHLACLRTLLRYPKWKYYINLSGQDFPLKTNYEIVEILKALNGSNDVEGMPLRHANGKIFHPPYGLFGFTGTPRVILNRETATFAARSPVSNSILAWASSTQHSDRNFFATINYNPRLKLSGTYRGSVNESVLKRQQHIATYSVSKTSNFSQQNSACKGEFDSGICVFGIDDLPLLTKRKELFVHKIRWDFQRATLACLEHEIQRRSKLQYLRPDHFNVTFYRNMTLKH